MSSVEPVRAAQFAKMEKAPMSKTIFGTLLILWGAVLIAAACFVGEWNQGEIVRRSLGLLTGAWLVYVGLAVIGLINIVGSPIGSLIFPRWSAPFVGLAVGGYVGASSGWYQNQFPSWELIVGGVSLGFCAGCLIWMLDPPPGPKTDCRAEMVWVRQGSQEAMQAPEQSLIGRILALLAILVWWAPGIGTGMGMAAVITNLKSGGWPSALGWIATAFSVVLPIAILLLALFE
jgi:hypothetical protein